MKATQAVLVAALVAALCAATAALAAMRAEASLASQFAAFKAEHGKVYASAEEEAYRLRVFEENMNVAQLQAVANPHATFGATKFADRTRAELDATLGGGALLPTEEEMRNREFMEVEGTAPSSFDWRMYGAVTPVKDQGDCDACWAFAAIGNIEGLWRNARNPLTALSEQVLVSCDKTTNGCDPSAITNSYKWLVNNQGGRVPTEASYPFVSGDKKVPPCKLEKTVVGAVIKGHEFIPTDEGKMATYLSANGPIATALDYTSFPLYKGGVLTNCHNGKANHFVLLVGYNKTNNPPYWIIKNSWGADWGEKGYIRIRYGTNECLVTTQPISAVLKSKIEDTKDAPPQPANEGVCYARDVDGQDPLNVAAL